MHYPSRSYIYFNCSACNIEFKNFEDQRKHYFSYHARNVNVVPKPNPTTTVSKSKDIRCETCNLSFLTELAFDFHVSGKKHINAATKSKGPLKVNGKVLPQTIKPAVTAPLSTVSSEFIQRIKSKFWSKSNGVNASGNGKLNSKDSLPQTTIQPNFGIKMEANELELPKKEATLRPSTPKQSTLNCITKIDVSPPVNNLEIPQLKLENIDSSTSNDFEQIQLPPAVVENFCCKDCDIKFSCSDKMKQHFDGSKHIKKLKWKQYISQKNDGTLSQSSDECSAKFVCDSCEVIYDTSEQLTGHLIGTKHLRNLSLNKAREAELNQIKSEKSVEENPVKSEKSISEQHVVQFPNIDRNSEFSLTRKCMDINSIKSEEIIYEQPVAQFPNIDRNTEFSLMRKSADVNSMKSEEMTFQQPFTHPQNFPKINGTNKRHQSPNTSGGSVGKKPKVDAVKHFASCNLDLNNEADSASHFRSQLHSLNVANNKRKSFFCYKCNLSFDNWHALDIHFKSLNHFVKTNQRDGSSQMDLQRQFQNLQYNNNNINNNITSNNGSVDRYQREFSYEEKYKFVTEPRKKSNERRRSTDSR